MKTHFHIRQRHQAYCETCGKPATHEVRNHQNANYGMFCEKHAQMKKTFLDRYYAQLEQKE